MADDKHNIRAVTLQEMEAYHRRKQGGGGDKPPSLKEIFREKFDEWTRPLRNRAKSIARREIFAMQDSGISITDLRLQRLDLQFNAIAHGGLKGTIEAYKILRAYPPSPALDPSKLQNG